MKTNELKEAIRQFFEQQQRTETDRWGNIKFELGGKQFRIKFQAYTFRREIKAGDRWVRLNTWKYRDFYQAVLYIGKQKRGLI